MNRKGVVRKMDNKFETEVLSRLAVIESKLDDYNNIKTILGGGDIVAAASNCNLKDKVFHASTGGGSTLEYLEGKKLPGIESIK